MYNLSQSFSESPVLQEMSPELTQADNTLLPNPGWKEMSSVKCGTKFQSISENTNQHEQHSRASHIPVKNASLTTQNS